MRNEKLILNCVPDVTYELKSQTLRNEKLIDSPYIRDRSQILNVNKIQLNNQRVKEYNNYTDNNKEEFNL